MNETHAVAGAGGAVLVAPLAGVLAAHHVPDPTDTSVLIVAVLGALYASIVWFVKWKWPSAPELPSAK